MSTSLTNKQKKEWAQSLIVNHGLSQREAAIKVGSSLQSVNKWYKEGNWEKLKQSMLITRSEQLNRLYGQLSELNNTIMSREAGAKFATSKEADTISKLAGAIKSMETEASIADIVEVAKRFTDWLRKFDNLKALEVANLFNSFIKDNLKK